MNECVRYWMNIAVGLLTLGIATFLSIRIGQYIDQIFWGLLLSNLFFVDKADVKSIIIAIGNIINGRKGE